MRIDGTTIAITGAGGFIGLHLVEALRARGAKVRGLDVTPGAAGRVTRAGAEAILGDVTRRDDLERLLQGAAAVVHTAAVVSEGGDRARFERINVGGTRNVIAAARASGVRRVVHLSSVMVYGFGFPNGVREEGPLAGEGNAYCETKIESEALVLDADRRGEIAATVIRPGDVYGPGSMPWIVRPLQMMKKRLFAVPRGGVLNHVWVGNLVDAIALSLEKDATGEAFNVSDGVATPVEDFFRRLAQIAGRRLIALPAPILRAAFGTIERAADAIRVEPPARASAVDFLMRPGRYSIEKAERVLGYRPRVDLDEGMARIASWARAEGLA
jgi:nucleoside-diphosphate-sugar epimerase